MFSRKVFSLFAALLGALISTASAEVQVTDADHYFIPVGETITLSGSGLEDATSASMIWTWRGELYPTSVNTVDTNTLEVVMPDVPTFLFGYLLLIETSSGSTVGIPSAYDELVSGGTVTYPSNRMTPLVVRSGAVLSGDHNYEIVVVETGGVLELADTPQLKTIIAEDGAYIDFEGAPGDFRTSLLHSPDTVLIGTTPTNTTTKQLTSIKPSYGVETFNLGYALNLNIIGDGTVSASPDQTYYRDNASIELTAIPEINSTFSGWSGDYSSTSNPLTVQISRAAINLTATFSPGWLLDIYDIPGVSVSTSPDLTTFPDSQSVTLTATVENGYTFEGWGGDASGTELSTTITMDANKLVFPIVRRDDYNQLPQISDADHYAIPVGETITLSGSGLEDATSASMLWTWRGELYPTSVNTVDTNTLEVVMPGVHSFLFGYLLLVETSSGSTVGIPSSYDELVSGGTATYPSSRMTPLVVRSGAVLSGDHYYEIVVVENGGVLKLADTPQLKTIIAEDGAVIDFEGAPGDFRTTLLHSPDTVIIGTTPTYTTTTQLTSIKPSYGIETFNLGYALNVNVIGDGTVTASPDQTYYRDNSSIELTAVPGSNSTFSGWSGDYSSTSNPLTVQISRAAINLTATFSPGWLLNIYEIPGVSVSASPDSSVYPDGTSVNLTATVDSGYTFLGWGGDATGSTEGTSITMDDNKLVMPIVRRDDYQQLPQISSADLHTLPAGETITLSGSGLEDATSASMLWTWRGELYPTSVNTVDTNTLEVVMPEVHSFLFGYLLLVETSSGSTIGIPSGYDELVSGGTVTFPSNRMTPLVVRSGAVLSGDHHYEIVVVETGGVLEVADTPQLKTIIAEDGAVIDFEGAPGDFNTTLLHSPDTAIVGATPNYTTKTQLTSIKPSYGVETFNIGYPLNLIIEGPGTVTVTPEKDYYTSNETISLTATPDPDTYFIRWIGQVSGHDQTISVRMRDDTMQTARFSTAPDYFSTWRLEHFTTEELQDLSISAFDADPDGDSVSNAAEYAFGTDPRDASNRYKLKVSKEQVNGEFQFQLRYTRPKNALDVTYQILVSKDFVTWNFNGDGTDLVYSTVIGTESIDADNEEVIVQLYPQGDSPKTFFVKISAILFE